MKTKINNIIFNTPDRRKAFDYERDILLIRHALLINLTHMI